MKIFVILAIAILVPVLAYRIDNGTKGLQRGNTVHNNTVSDEDGNPSARCYDSKLATFINSAVSYYSHDMGQLAKYILDQIVRARYSGSWFVHAEMISSQRQGLEWQSVTNGDLFAATSRHGCYYHDTQTYIIILRY
uniref:Uncharacterized protein n=1 Tax=Acrobeloides nanus TaxID=290746 RepID=A0A914CIN2_9BILA